MIDGRRAGSHRPHVKHPHRASGPRAARRPTAAWARPKPAEMWGKWAVQRRAVAFCGANESRCSRVPGTARAHAHLLGAGEVHPGPARRRPSDRPRSRRPARRGAPGAIHRSDDKEREHRLVAAPDRRHRRHRHQLGVHQLRPNASPERAGLRRAHLRPPRTGRPDPGGVTAAQAPVPGHHARALRTGGLPTALHVRGLRGPVHPGRCVVHGADLPPAAGAQASAEGRRRGPPVTQQGPATRGSRPRPNKRYTPPT